VLEPGARALQQFRVIAQRICAVRNSRRHASQLGFEPALAGAEA
jgi:hypothetical protein